MPAMLSAVRFQLASPPGQNGFVGKETGFVGNAAKKSVHEIARPRIGNRNSETVKLQLRTAIHCKTPPKRNMFARRRWFGHRELKIPRKVTLAHYMPQLNDGRLVRILNPVFFDKYP
jgi:hypothetical protein